MNPIELHLTSQERDFLVNLLDSTLIEKHAETRRTEFSSQLHDQLWNEETQLRQLLERLREPELV
jgi:hypothetical protein